MNEYKTTFFAHCPFNGYRILYELTITTTETIMVEEIIDTVSRIGDGIHEDIADLLAKKFVGCQTLTANHHGVQITTTRDGE